MREFLSFLSLDLGPINFTDWGILRESASINIQELRKLVPSGEMFTRIAIKEAPNIAGLFIMKTTRLYRVIAINQLSDPIVCNESTNDPFDD